ncbi:MAG: DUF6602 domain-containing protein [Bacillota bacterium]
MDAQKDNPGCKFANSKNRNEQALQDIIRNYQNNEESLVQTLHLGFQLHGGVTGGFREEIWKQMFEQMIPKKFVIQQSVFILDSHQQVSREVDLAIMDETYTPYIFRYGKLKFIPIEAVAVVIECKSKNIKSLVPWANQIKKLKTSQHSIARMYKEIAVGKEEDNEYSGTAQSATRPIRVLCALENPKRTNDKKLFDFVIIADEKTKKLIVRANYSKELYKWYSELNHAQTPSDIMEKASIKGRDLIKDKSLSNYIISKDDVPNMEKEEIDDCISLLTLNFQLNQLLILINNPILFPHQAYAKMFNDVWKEMK